MNNLSNLTFVDEIKPKSIPLILRMRNKLSDRIWEQIKLAEAKQMGSNYAPLKTKRLRDTEGNIKQIELPKRIKPWWFTSHSGKLCLSIYYGTKRIEITPGKPAIDVKDIEGLTMVLNTLKQAVENGELDQQILSAGETLKMGFRK